MGICTSDEYYERHLISNDFENLKVFSFENIITKCKVVDVYDGDTVKIVFYFNDKPIKLNFRLYGYDAPEIKPIKGQTKCSKHVNPNNLTKLKCNECNYTETKEQEYRNNCKKAAEVTKQYLISKLLNKIVWVKFTKEEKYGRSMGWIYMIDNRNKNKFSENTQSINSMIIANQLGKIYNGEKKADFTSNELQHIISFVE